MPSLELAQSFSDINYSADASDAPFDGQLIARPTREREQCRGNKIKMRLTMDLDAAQSGRRKSEVFEAFGQMERWSRRFHEGFAHSVRSGH